MNQEPKENKECPQCHKRCDNEMFEPYCRNCYWTMFYEWKHNPKNFPDIQELKDKKG